MRDYQRTQKNPYKLPHNLYHQIKYVVRDYDRLQSEFEKVITQEMRGDKKTKKIEKLLQKINAIEQGLNEIPVEYRKGIENHIT